MADEAEHMNNVGKFTLPKSVMVDNPDVALKVFATVIVLEGKPSATQHGTYEYVAISPGFEELEEGGEIPSYDIQYDEESEEVSWSKV